MKARVAYIIASSCVLIGVVMLCLYESSYELEVSSPVVETKHKVDNLEDVNKYLKEEFGDDSVYIIKTTYKKVDGKFQLYPIFFEGLSDDYNIEFTGDQYKDITSIIDTLSNYEYVLNQSDPNLLKEQGGNCQAFALAVNYYCDLAEIKNEFVILPEHVYNEVIINNKKYTLDITKEVFE